MSGLAELYEAVALALRGPGPAEALRVVCRSAASVLAVSGVAISTMSSTEHRDTVCASDRVAGDLEELQFTLGEGPCFEAFDSGVPVLVPDLAASDAGGWPIYAAQAVERSPARAVFVFPLHLGSLHLGTFGAYRTTPGPLDVRALAAALELAETAALVLLGSQDPEGPAAREQRETLVRQGRARPNGHERVHIAAGMLAERLGVAPDAAFDLMRGRAYLEGRFLVDVAADVLERPGEGWSTPE